MLAVCLIREEKRMEVQAGRREIRGVGGKKGYSIYSSSCDLIHIRRVVG